MLLSLLRLRIRKPSSSLLPSVSGFQTLLLSLVHDPPNVSCDSYHTRTSPARISTSHRDVSVDQNVSRSNYIITQLSRDGKITDARRIFEHMPSRDVVSWTALISGYIKYGMIQEARRLFEDPMAEKNVVTWTAMLSGYVRSKMIKEAVQMFEEMPEKNVVSWNTMISGYAENGFVDDAYNLFKKMPVRNVVSWNTIVTALAQSGKVDEAFKLFERMPERDVISWTAMVAGLSQNGRIDEARVLFDEMPERNVVSWNAMISGYMQNLRLDEALLLFEKMPERDIPSWNTMITGFMQNGNLRRAHELFDRMQERNVVTWTSLITGYAQDGQGEEALKVFTEMLRDGIGPNQGTFVSVLAAVSNLAGLGEGKQIHQIICKTIFQFSPFVESALISMYAKCGEIGIAWNMFELTDRKDTVSWNSMIAAYAHHGCGSEAIFLFHKMQRDGFKPDGATYVAMLSACSHSGLVDEGFKLFGALLRDKSIEVREDHYACLVDLCGRAGRIEEVTCFINGLKGDPSTACVWGALLAGCNVHGNVTIGKLAAKRLLQVEPKNAGTYMLLSNIYASAGRWKDAAKVRLKMNDEGLKKQPGCSWIEVGNRIHVFMARDKSHIHSRVTYCLLQDLHYMMKLAGYSPINTCLQGDDLLVSVLDEP